MLVIRNLTFPILQRVRQGLPVRYLLLTPVYPIVRSAPAFIPIVAFMVFAERISLRGGGGSMMIFGLYLTATA